MAKNTLAYAEASYPIRPEADRDDMCGGHLTPALNRTFAPANKAKARL